MKNKKTLVIGASPNPARYSFMAIQLLRQYGHDVIALAKRTGQVADVDIQTSIPQHEKVHTITLYVGKDKQHEYSGLLIQLTPQRVIFNPGAENPELYKKLQDAGIQVTEGCTLVMLRTGQF